MTNNIEQIWSLAKQQLAQKLSPSNFKTWIDPLVANCKNNVIYINSPNSFFLTWIKEHFAASIYEAVNNIGEKENFKFTNIELAYVCKKTTAEESNNSSYLENFENTIPSASFVKTKAKPMWGDLLHSTPMRLNPRYTFDDFVVGNSNLYAYAAAKALANGENLGSDALFITSDHGLGKSHLSQAVGQTFLKQKPESHIYYLTAEDFTNEMVNSIRLKTMEQFKDKYRHQCDVLVLEEVNFLAGKDKVQTELCFTIDYLIEQGKKIIFTSPQEPKDIPRLGRQLKSRLSTALISPIKAPDFENRFKILTKKATDMNIKVSRHVLEYISERITSDVRQLESSLVSLNAKSQILNKVIDLEMTKETLSYMFDEDESSLSPNNIRNLICRYFQVNEKEILSKSRRRNLIEARSIGMYLSRTHTRYTLEEIGDIFGRNHSSTLYAINKLETKLKKDSKTKATLEFLSEKLIKA